MYKSKNTRMKSPPLKLKRTFLRSIYFVTQDGMTDRCHMHTYLVRTPRL